ncbi:hypothetical protein INR49_022726, partial [Caranx melampygus]
MWTAGTEQGDGCSWRCRNIWAAVTSHAWTFRVSASLQRLQLWSGVCHLAEVEGVDGSRLWDVDQPGVFPPQDGVVPQTDDPDEQQEQSCRETETPHNLHHQSMKRPLPSGTRPRLLWCITVAVIAKKVKVKRMKVQLITNQQQPTGHGVRHQVEAGGHDKRNEAEETSWLGGGAAARGTEELTSCYHDNEPAHIQDPAVENEAQPEVQVEPRLWQNLVRLCRT